VLRPIYRAPDGLPSCGRPKAFVSRKYPIKTNPLTLFGQFRARLGRYAVGFGLLLSYQVAQFWFDKRLMRAVDAARGGELRAAQWLAGSLVVIALAAFVVRVASRIAIFYAGRDAEYALRRALLDKLYDLGPSFYAKSGTGDLMSRATNDLAQVRLLLGFGVLNVINTALALISALSVMVSISVPLTVAALVPLPFLALVTRAFSKRIFLRTRENQAALGAMSNTVQSSLTAIRVVRAFGLESAEAQRFEVDNASVRERGLELAKLRGLIGPIMQAISAIGIIVVFWYGGHLLVEGRITAGGLLSFVRAMTRLTWPLIALGFLVSMVQRGRAAYERLREVFDTKSDVDPEIAPPRVPGAPCLETRNLSYCVGEREVLSAINLKIAEGERIAIVGATGSGKSMLAKLLAGALPASKGTVLVDGRAVESLSRAEVRRRICHSQQVPFLFSSTVAQNLAYALPEASSAAAHHASVDMATRVRLDAEIRQLVHGYDTVVGERGLQLSGGQRQRVALGRALLSSSPVLILDDPTSSVDVGTERALCQMFAELGRDRTLVMITHRISLASQCDRVIVLEAGRVVEVGPPSQLAQGSGLYHTFSEEQRLESEIEDDEVLAVRSASTPTTRVAASASESVATSERDQRMREFHEESELASAFKSRLYRDLLRTVRDERGRLMLAAVAVVFTATFGLMRPMYMRSALDAAVGAGDVERLGRLGVVVALLAFGEQLMGFVQTYTTQIAGAESMARLRARVFAFLHRLPIAFFDRQPVGRLTTRVTNDIDAISELFASGILGAIGDLLRLAGIVVLMLMLDVTLSLSAFAALPIVILLVLFLRRPLRDAFRAIRRQTARMNAALNEQISGMAVIQAFDKVRRSADEFDQINRAHRDAHLNSIRFESVQDAALETVASVALACMVFAFGTSHASTGTLLAFQLYLAQFFEPLSQLTQRYTLLQSALAGAERVFGLLDTEERDAPGQLGVVASTAAGLALALPVATDSAVTRARNSAALVAFEDVEFSYYPGVPVLRQLSFSMTEGEHLALVGPTGSGKSTVAALLLRLYDAQSGQIYVNGKSVLEVDVDWLRRQFALVPQDPVLFPGTLLSNIAGADPVERERARAVLERMGALQHFELRLGGLDAVVGSKGVEYSVGERQLVAFARALYRDAPILLLDEATASIDSDTEACLQRALLASLSERTAIVIAHRLSTIKAADRILVLSHGSLAEQGSHRELMQSNGLYRRLVALSAVRQPGSMHGLGA